MVKPVEAVKQYRRELRLNALPGMRCHLWQRLTGLGILGYLFMHITVIGSVSLGPDTFDRVIKRVTEPRWLLAPLEFLLLVVLVFHALNGLRIIALEFGTMARHHRLTVWAMMLGFGVLVALGGVMFLMYVLKG